MRILMVSEDLPSPSLGGLAKHVLTLCKSLTSEGHQVDLMGNNDNIWPDHTHLSFFSGRFIGELRGQFEGWKEMRMGIFNPAKRSHIARRFAHVIKRYAKHYDVIHYHGHLPNIAHYIPSHINFIQTRHDQGSECLMHIRFKRGAICENTEASACAECRASQPNWIQKQLSVAAVNKFRHEVMSGFKKHKTVFVSEFIKSRVQRCFNGENWGITLHNFIDADEISKINNTLHDTGRKNIDSSTIRIFIAAKLYPPKGVVEFMEEINKHDIHHLRIHIAGDGEQEQLLRERYQNSRIHILGWQSPPNTITLAAQADVIVVPSLCEEACSTTVLEGLTLGKTVFALQRGGTPELTVYEKFPGQLKLYADMPSLAAALARFQPASNLPVAPHRHAHVQNVAKSLIKLYQLPPGSISA